MLSPRCLCRKAPVYKSSKLKWAEGSQKPGFTLQELQVCFNSVCWYHHILLMVVWTGPNAAVGCALGQTPSSSWWRSCFTFPKPGITETGMERSQGVSLYSSLLLPQCPQGHILEWSLQFLLNKENFPVFFGILLCFPSRSCGFNRLFYFNVLPPCPQLCLYNWISVRVCIYLLLAFIAVKLYSVMWLRVSDKYQSSLKLN